MADRHRRVAAAMLPGLALAVALLTGAGLMTWGFLHKVYGGSGIDPKQVLTAHVRLTEAQYEDPAKQLAFFRDAIDRLEALPGVISVGGATTLVGSEPDGNAIEPLSEFVAPLMTAMLSPR